jgi:uncharacterized protein (DUF58 family)
VSAAAPEALPVDRAPGPDTSLLDPEMTARLAQLALIARRIPEARRKGRRRTRRIGSGTDAIDTRPYALGDDPRRIAWPAYARLERLLTRVVADEAPLRLILIVDQSASMGFGSPTKLRQACRIAAGLAAVALSGEDRVAALAVDETPGAALTATNGRKGLARLLRVLDGLEPKGKTRLTRAAGAAGAVARGRGLCVVLSDCFDPDGVTSTLRSLAARGHEVALVEVLDPFEIDPPDLSGAELEDEETGEIVELPAGGAKEAYLAALEAHRTEIDEALAELDAPVLRVTTEEPFDSVVGKALAGAFLARGTR